MKKNNFLDKIQGNIKQNPSMHEYYQSNGL